MKILRIATIAAALTVMAACSSDDPDTPVTPTPDPTPTPSGSGTAANDLTPPDFNADISAWDGTTADDASADVPGTDADIYHEANSFTNIVTVTYSGTSATVECANTRILSYVSGAHVVIDAQTNSVSGVKIVAKGTSTDGSLKVYGRSKWMLSMQGLDLTSQRGPAVNIQCGKRVFLELADGTVNSLTDCATYSDDIYYYAGATAASEDRKGAFFCEGRVIVSGSGVLKVAGKCKHAFAVDASLTVRPGATVVVTEAASNGFQIKGDTDDSNGVRMLGGLLYAWVQSDAGKALKTDYNVSIEGGTLLLNTSGGSIYDSSEQDTSSPACIKAGGTVSISAGAVTLKSTGSGGKGINATGNVTLSGGTVTVATSGDRYVYTQAIKSSPRGIKTDASMSVTGGTLRVAVTGTTEGCEGIETGTTMSVSGGDIYVYAYDDAINCGTVMTVTDGTLYAASITNDGIDANTSLTVSSGTVTAIGGSSPESGIDVDASSKLILNGGVIVSYAGSLQSQPSSASKQQHATFSNVSIAKGATVNVVDASGATVYTFTSPRTISGGTVCVSTPALASGQSYTLSAN